jgi:apolipoprotein D and lipocalin family protein
MTGNAYTTEPGKLGVSFNSVFSTGSGAGNITNYIVVDTDYKSYSLVYSCTTKYGFLRTEVAWILSRERTLDKATVDKLLVKIKEISPTLVANLKPTDQTNCPN